MVCTILDSNETSSDIVALNVRAFLDIDQSKIKIRYADMKDEEPLWIPDLAPSHAKCDESKEK